MYALFDGERVHSTFLNKFEIFKRKLKLMKRKIMKEKLIKKMSHIKFLYFVSKLKKKFSLSHYIFKKITLFLLVNI